VDRCDGRLQAGVEAGLEEAAGVGRADVGLFQQPADQLLDQQVEGAVAV